MFLEQLENRSLMAVLVWDGSANNLWSNAANWVGDVAPLAGDDLVFPAAAGNLANVNDLAVGTRFNTILIQGNGYSLTGAAIELSGGVTANNTVGTNTYGLDTTLINAQTFMSANPGTTLNVTGAINTANLVGSYFVGQIPAIVFDGQGDANVSGVISGAGGLSKLGGGTLTLGGNNTFEGIAEARQGFIRVTNNNGLGSAFTAHTEVQAGAAVELSGVTTAESFAIREGGVGFGNGTDISSAGALRAVGGTTSTVTGNVELIGGNDLIGATAGSTLNLAGQILAPLSGGNRRLVKVGPGTVVFSGSQPNVYTGDTVVLQGRLDLNKSGGGDKAIPANLIIGDNIGGDNAAEVRLLASDQIAQLNPFDVAINTITLASSGVLTFGGNNDVVGNLTLTTGNTYSSDVTTGAGTLTLGGNLTLSAFQGSSGVTPAATIAGNLNLGTFFSGGASGTGAGATRTFSIADTQLQHIGTDLLISANITGTIDVSITQTGVGTLQLAGNNSGWNGPYIMQGGGVLELASNTALGNGGLVSLQNSGNVLRAIGGSRTINNPLSLDGNVTFLGDDNTPGVENLTFTGPATLTGTRTLLTMDPTQNVTFSGVIDEGIFGSQGISKSGRGVLTLTAPNTYSGTTTVNSDSGTLVLSGNGSLLNNGGLTVGIGGTLLLDNSGTVVNNRLDDARSISLSGRLLLRGNAGANVQEQVGPTDNATDQAPIFEVENNSGGAFSSVLVVNATNVGGNRPTRFVGTGVALSESGPNRIEFSLSPGGLDDGILPQAVVVGPGGTLDFATYGSGPNGIAIIPLPASAYVTDLSQASTTSNVRLTGANVLTGNKNVNAILFDDGATLSGPASSILTIASGAMLFRGDSSITVPSANIGAGFFYVDAGKTVTVSSNIFSGSVEKQGPGKLIFTGDNQYTGSTVINEGVLNIQRSTSLGSPAGGTFARANATLELEQTSFGPLVIGLELLTADGTGGVTNQGAIRNVAGSNSWAGTVTVNGVAANLLSATGGFPLSNVTIPFVRTETGSTLTITGDFPGTGELAKVGGGTLELAGAIVRGQDRNNRVLEGTMLLNNEPGVQASRGRYFIGSNAPGAPAATLRLGASDQIIDDRGVTVFGTGLFDLNGFSDVIGEGLTTHISAVGAGKVNIGAGGSLTVNANTQVFTQGTGNPTGSTITGGTFGLQLFGIVGAASARTIQVNEGAVGNDLTITSAIVDGSGAQPMGVTKTGFGQLEFGGTAANTFTGDTVINEGTLILNKGTGAGGVDALAGRVFVGDNNITNGFSASDILRLAQPNQIPDFLAPVDLRTTGRWELNGNNETIGQADVQTALTLRSSSSVDLGGATLSLIGNIATNANEGATIWTPLVSPRISGGTLNLGNLPRTVDVGGDQASLPYELEIAANLTGTGGFLLANTGTLLLSGDNSGLTGDVIRTNGNFAVGSDTALGSGRAMLNGTITSYGGKRTIGTEIIFGANTIGYISGNNTAGVGAIGGGGNDLEFAGPVNVTPGTWQPSVPSAAQLTFSGGIGETLGPVFTRKFGFGTMIVSSVSTLSGNVEIGENRGDITGAFVRANGGTLVLRDNGTWVNGSMLIGYGGTLQLDNSGVALANRLGNTAALDMSGGALALVGKAGVAVGESMGALNLRENSSSSQVQALLPAAAGSIATWRFTNYSQSNVAQGSSVQFVGRGADITATGANRIAFNVTPGLTDGIIQTGVMSGSGGFDFATITNATPTVTPFDNFLGALTSGPNFATSLAAATATVNVKLSASEVVGGAVSANALLLANGGISVSGAGSLTLDASMIASRGAGNSISVATLTGAANTIIYVDRPTSTLDISSVIAGAATSLAKAGTGLLNVSGNNTFAGATRITDGVLRASSNTTFGTTAGNVVVSYGGTVELNGVNIPAEQIFFGGFGEANTAAVGVRALTGTTNTWNGIFQLDNNRSAVEVGALGRLTIVGQLNSGNGLNKTGLGTLEFQGGANNVTGAIQIWQGTLELNKTPGSNAANGTITVGDNVGGPNADRLVLLNTNQIQDTNNITVTSTGVFNYGTFTETINLFSIQAGLVGSGSITGTGAGALSIVNNSSIDTLQNSGAGGAFGPTTIDGTLVLAGTAPRILNVNDTTNVLDANMPAVLGSASVNFQKDGAGRLALSGNSSAYAGSITLNGGETVVQNANALGNATGNTTVNANISLLLDGVSLAEPLSLNGAGFGGPGAIRNISGNNTLTGAITLAGTATIGVNAGQTLNINAPISGANQGVTKLLPGTLQYSGGAANTYSGTTSVSEGTLELNKSAGVDAIAGVLTVGNDAGAQDADLVRLLAADQINNGVQVQVTPSGRLDLNNNNETIGNNAQTGLNLFLAVTTAPRVTTGTGTLTLLTGVGIQTQLAGGVLTTGVPINAPGATITGLLNLGNVAHNLNAIDSGLNIRELQIDATINGGGASGALNSSGTGLAYITGNNTGLTATTTISAGGGIVIGNSSALGSGTINVTGNSNLFTSGYGGPAGAATFTLANPITLNADLVIRGDQNLVLNGQIAGQGAATRTLTLNTHNSGAVTIGTGGIALSNSATAQTFVLNNNTYNQTTATISGPIVNGSGAANHAFTKGGAGWLTLTNNANSFAGVTTVAAGFLQVTADNALGVTGSITANQTTVNSGGTLVVAPGVNLVEWLVLNNNGVGNLGSLRLLDTVPGTTQTATIAGNVNFNTTAFVGVDGGGANPDRLIFSGTLASGGGQMNKVGLGEMEVAGATDNGVAFTGAPSAWDDGLFVRQGSLLLNKSGANRAIVGAQTITVGDSGGGSNSARLILIGSGTDQLGGNLNVDIGANGQFTFAGATTSEQINQLQIFRLASAAGSVNTTAAGTLIISANIFASNAGFTDASTPAATIAGNVNLNGGRNVNASDSFVLNPADDLVISAVLSNGSINVDGDGGRSGTVVLTGTNTYGSGTTVTGQTIDFNQSFTHGLNVFVAGTLVVRDGGTLGTGNVTVNAGGSLVLDNAAANANRIVDTATLTMNAGNLTLIGNATGSNETVTTLTLNAGDGAGQANRVTVDSSGGGVTVLQTTNLNRGGTGTAEFIGVGANLGDTTNSRINITAGTNPFVNSVIPWATVSGPAGYDLATDGDAAPASAPYFIGRVLTYNSSVNAGGIVRLNGGTDTLTADRTVDALLLENGATVNGAFMLTVGTATSGLVVTRTGNNSISTTGSAGNPALQFGGREPLFLTETGSSLAIPGTINATATMRKERGGSLVLSGDNDIAVGTQISGAININAGTVTVSHEDALGSEPGGTVTVNRRAALILDTTATSLNFGNKAFNVSGLGLNDNGTGALRTLGTSGVNIGTGTTAVNWNTSPTIVDVNNGNIVRLFATIGGGGNTLTKVGGGALAYNGTAANTNTGAVSVNEGTLTLEKSGTNVAVGGSVTINDLGNYDPAGTGRVLYVFGTSTNQIADGASVTVNVDGQFDMSTFTDTINALTIAGGTVTTGTGTLTENGALTLNGGSFTGNLVLNNNITYNSGLASGGLPVLNGTLNLGGATRTMTINDGYAVNDVVINSTISNGRVIKNGNGGLLLTNGGNTFLSGTSEVQRIVIAGATAGTSQFRITFNGSTSGIITVGATDAATQANIQAALDAMQNILPGGVAVTNTAAGQFDLTFTGSLGEVDLVNQITTTVVTAPGTFTPSTVTNGSTGVRLDAGILALSSATALGTARLHINGSSQLLPQGGDLTLANSVTMNPNITVTFGGRRDFGGTDDLTLSGPVTLVGAAAAQVINWDVNDNQTDVAFSGVVSGGGDLLVPVKRGIGRLTLAGNNTFDVRDSITGANGGTGQTDGLRVENGTLRLANSNALGGGLTANVQVRNDYLSSTSGVIELDGSGGAINLPANRNIVVYVVDNQLGAWGLYGRASATNETGAIRSLSGANSIAGILDVRNIGDNDNFGRIAVGVDAGRLTLTNSIFGTRNNANSDIRNNRDFIKVGAGELELTGSLTNQITGNTAVLGGTLILNKSPGVLGISGPLVVGDNVGAANSDVVILAQAEQLPDTSTVLIAGSGQLQTSAAQAASLTNEVQQVQIGNAAPAGQFRLQFNGSTTSDISFGASLASIQTALNNLASIGGVGGNVLVLGTGSGQNQAFTVTFLGSLAGVNQSQLKVVAGTTPYSAATVTVTTLTPGGLAGRETVGAATLRIANQGAGNISLQPGSTLALTGDVTVDNYGALTAAATTGAAIAGGNLDLRQTSANGATINRNFNVNADAPAVDDLTISSTMVDGAFGSIANVNKAGAANSRLAISGTNTYVGQVTVSNGDLAITSSVALGSVLTDEVQSYVINNVLGNASGTYTITTDQGVTVPLAFNASADDVQAALETIYGVGNVKVVSAINGNTNTQYFIRWLPGARADYPITRFTPTGTTVLNTALSYADVNALDAANVGFAGTLNFEGLWSGFVTVGAADPLTWSFGTNSDDGSILLIDLNNDGRYTASERVVNNLGFHGAVAFTSNVTFPAAGTYRIAIGFMQATGGGVMEARFAKSANATYAEQAIINPGLAAQAGIWSDEASIANQLTTKWFNQVPTASGADLDPSIQPITLTNNLLVNASFGAVATHQEGGQPAGTNVAAGAALELRGGAGMTVVNEPLTLNGVGVINAPTRGLWNNAFQGAVGTGNLRNVSGDNVWQGNLSGFGNISLANNITAAIGVDAGTSLTSNGTTGNISNVLVTAGSLIKTGAGVLETAGLAANQYTGNTSVQQGTYRLNKSGNQPAIQGGEVIVGDSIGGDNADVLLYAPTAGGDQIVNRTIRVSASGLLNLNNVSDTNNAGILLDVGPTFSADVSTGTGVLTSNNQFTAVNQAGTTATSVPAVVAGIYDLNASTRNVDVREGNAPVELNIAAVIQATPAANGLTKIGRGTLAISGSNTYTGTTTINSDSGTLLANTPNTVAISPYTVGAGSILGGTGTITGAVTVNGVGSNLAIGGVVNPGPNAPAPANTGILTVNNNITFGAGAQLQADINGTTVGTQYDQLVVSGSVTTTGNAVPNISNTSTIAGTTGNGFQPVNGVDAFKLINKAGVSPTITLGTNSFLSFILPQAPQTSPTTVVIGGKTYTTSYNTALGLNDGNDFVLQAVAAVRVWDGRVDNSIVNASDAWTLATNWVGDIAPFAGDDLAFNDVGIGNGKTTPINDYAAGFDFRSINFANTTGSYTVTGNSVLLNAATGGVTSDNTTNVPVTNSLNIPLTTAVNPQSVTVKDGSTLNLGGAIGLAAAGPLTVTNGVGADANGTAVFGGTIDGASTLTINMIGANGDATFNGAIGGVTPLNSILVTTVDDVSFNSTIAATTVSQATGTGLTTLSGGTVTGTLNMTTEAFSLGGGTLNVTGATTLNATLGGIADGNGAANNLTGPSLTATAITGINLDTTIVDLTATNTGAGNVAVRDADALNILGLSVVNGNAVISAGGALTDGATAVTSVSGNGSFSAPTITLGDTAGDSFNLGSLSFPSSGAVTITEDSIAQLAGTSAATSLNLTSLAAITNAASTSLLVTNNASLTGTSITLGNQLGDLINFGTLTFTSPGVVNISEDSATQLAGTSSANSIVLNSTGALTNAAAASVTVTNNANFTAASVNLGGAAGDVVNFGSLTFAATAGPATIAEDSSLDLAGANTATGAIQLTSVDAAAVGQDINLPFGAALQSTTSSVTLNAGDNATIAGNITSALTTTINVDAGDAESNGVAELVAGTGGTVTITGVITTPAVGSGGGTFLFGNDDFDTFTLSPQTTTEFRIDGGLPVSQTTGDVLNLNVSGTTTPNLTIPGSIAPYTGPGSGAWSFASAHLPVLFKSIEDSTITGNYHLTYDNSTAPVGNLVVMRDAAQTRLQIRSGSSAGPVLFQGLLAPIQSLRVLGSAGNDMVTVDDINTLPNFAGTVPGVTDNGNLAGTAEFLFDGLGGTDTLVYNINGTTASQTYAIGNGTGAAGLEGEIESIAAGVDLLSYFQNVELTQRTGSGATPGGLAIIGDSSDNAFQTTANNPFTRTTATGYTPFEFSGSNYNGLSVSGGLGLDTLELLGIGNGQVAPLASTFNGDAGNDTLRVHSTSGNTGTVTLNGGLGDDLFQLFSLTNTVDAIAGPVVVDGTDGNVGGNTDSLVIVDSGDATADTVFINAVNPGVSDNYRVEGINTAAGNDVTFRNIDSLNYTSTQANDTIDAKFVSTAPQHDLTTVSLSGWRGGDQFYLFTSDQVGGSGPGVTPTGTPSGVASISLYGDAPGNPNAGDGNDIFGETPAGLTGTGIMNVGLVVPDTTRMIRPSVSTSIAIDGGQPTGLAAPQGDVTGDVNNVDISALPNSTPVIVSTFSPGTVVAPGISPLNWTQIEDLNLVDQGKLTNVQMGDLFARTTPNPDLVQITRDPTLFNPNQLRLRITATIGSYSATNKTIIYGGGMNDTITQANLTIPAEFYGEDGDDVLSGAINNDWLVGGLGNDRINGGAGDNVIWGDNAPTSDNPNPQDTGIGGDDQLSGLAGNDVFYGGAGNDLVSAGAGDDYVSGGQGNDTLGGYDGNDRLYGGAGNDVINGHAGDDLVSGGDGDDRVYGDDGNDVVFGGSGVDELNGGNGNDLLVTGSVANENTIRTSVASVGNYSPATYTDALDNDAALLTLLTQWASTSNHAGIAAITHDGVDDDVFGQLGDDDFCWEAADIADDFPAVAPPDYNATGMGADERFGPT